MLGSVYNFSIEKNRNERFNYWTKRKINLKNSVIMGASSEMFWNESKRNRTNVWFNFTKRSD
jgi:hypothetical protein